MIIIITVRGNMIENIENIRDFSYTRTTDPRENEDKYFVTHDKMDAFLKHCIDKIHENNQIDSLIVYFSGHGFESDFTMDSKAKYFHYLN